MGEAGVRLDSHDPPLVAYIYSKSSVWGRVPRPGGDLAVAQSSPTPEPSAYFVCHVDKLHSITTAAL